jgi:hypothetical protein
LTLKATATLVGRTTPATKTPFCYDVSSPEMNKAVAGVEQGCEDIGGKDRSHFF